MVAFIPQILTQEERKKNEDYMYKTRLNLTYSGILDLNSEKLNRKQLYDDKVIRLENEFRNKIKNMSNELHNKYDIIEDLQSDRIVQLNQVIDYDILNNLNLNVKLLIIIKLCTEYLAFSKSVLNPNIAIFEQLLSITTQYLNQHKNNIYAVSDGYELQLFNDLNNIKQYIDNLDFNNDNNFSNFSNEFDFSSIPRNTLQFYYKIIKYYLNNIYNTNFINY
jgi:hypothetical protein